MTMRDRHFPRLCRTCDAPMSRQEDTCWRCGAAWSTADEQVHLRVIPGAAPERTLEEPDASAVAATATG
jgi:predicted amidophosphoribosyltransferase